VAALPSKIGNLRLRRGERIRLETSGGGGFGAPDERSERDLAADRIGGYASGATV
jgi:N-methylhydantoinase B